MKNRPVPKFPIPKNLPPAELDRIANWPVLNLPPPAGTPGLVSRAMNDQAMKDMFDLVSESNRRDLEPLPLYKPMPQQQAFHESDAFIRLAIGSNRAGKTIGCAAEFSRAVLNCDPYAKYPTSGIAYIIGKSLKHIGDTIYRKLFQPGVFRMIRNERKQWEIFRPWTPQHLGREAETRPSGALIPGRFIVERAYEKKATNEMTMCRLSTGWEIRFFSAKGQLPMGNAVDLVWPDEELPDSPEGAWIPEMMARLVDRQGKLIWSAAPQSGYENLNELSDKADRQLENYRSNPVLNRPPEIIRFDMRLDDNMFQAKENVERFSRNLSDEDRAIRFEGVSLLNSYRMYPEFRLGIHGLPILTVPDHWCRYAIIDPGHTIAAVLFLAVPPPDECPHYLPTVVAYDEMYLAGSNATVFAQRLKEKIGNSVFEGFFGDRHGLRPSDAGSGTSVETQYYEAMQKAGVRSNMTGSAIAYAPADRRAGVLKVREYLMERPGGRPQFLVAVHPDDHSKCLLPNFYTEIKKYRKKMVGKHFTDEGEDRGYTHLMQCLRYGCMMDLQYVEPSRVSPAMAAFQAIQNWKSRMMARSSGDRPYVNL